MARTLANLKQIAEIKQKIITEFIMNNNIVAALDGDVSVLPDTALINNNIFPFFFIPNKETDKKSYIIIRLYAPKISLKYLADVVLEIGVFSHKDLMSYYGNIRTDYIISEIDKILNGNDTLGVDECSLVSLKPFIPQYDYDGYLMTYKITVRNQSGCVTNG